MCEKIMPLWRDFSLHIYRTKRERLGFNAVNFILGEMPLSQSNRVKNFIILLSIDNTFLLVCFKIRNSLYVGYYAILK